MSANTTDVTFGAGKGLEVETNRTTVVVLKYDDDPETKRVILNRPEVLADADIAKDPSKLAVLAAKKLELGIV